MVQPVLELIGVRCLTIPPGRLQPGLHLLRMAQLISYVTLFMVIHSLFLSEPLVIFDVCVGAAVEA